MRLVLFDVDGTLIDNRGGPGGGRVDDACFARAFDREFGIAKIEMEWSRYPHCTDSCITRVVLADRFGRPATDEEIARSRDAYVAELRAAADSGVVVASPIRGIESAFEAMAAAGWSAALATGGWRASALFKLSRGLAPAAALPGAFADDHESREGISTIARARAEALHGRAAERVVYVGDATWDVKACAALRLPFVGIGVGARADKLRGAGATTVLPDYAEGFLGALETAAPPVAARG